MEEYVANIFGFKQKTDFSVSRQQELNENSNRPFDESIEELINDGTLNFKDVYRTPLSNINFDNVNNGEDIKYNEIEHLPSKKLKCSNK